MGRKPKKNRPLDHLGSDRRPKATPGAPAADSRWALVLCGFLLLAVALVFGQTIRYGFVNYDDDLYVYGTPQVVHGLTVEGVGWAFGGSHANNWHPLTWLSHMLDCEVYGLNAGGHHLTSVLLHAAAAVVLLLVLWRMTGNRWPSALAAAVFAVHPLRVESVAWVAERKDVLSGLFFMLTLAAYVGYVRRNSSLARYLGVVALFALGLMAKPMLVTLPLVLLLLDYWPLDRWRASTAWRLVVEKVPLLLLAAASCVATPLAQGEAIRPLDAIPMTARIANALVSYVTYLGQFVYPAGLAVFYPYPEDSPPLWKVAGALLVLAAISAAAVVWRRRLPYLFVGWFWYVGMLVPVIGLVQIGLQAMADRYTYLPQIGLCIAVAWGAADAAATWPAARRACGIVSAVAVLALLGCAWRQTCYWRDSETLWTRALACTVRNAVAHNNLGTEMSTRQDFKAAIDHYRQAIDANPKYAEAHNNLGTLLAATGQLPEGIVYLQKALELKPDYAQAHGNLGLALARSGQTDAAIGHYQRALELKPDFAAARANLADALAERAQRLRSGRGESRGGTPAAEPGRGR